MVTLGFFLVAFGVTFLGLVVTLFWRAEWRTATLVDVQPTCTTSAEIVLHVLVCVSSTIPLTYVGNVLKMPPPPFHNLCAIRRRGETLQKCFKQR